MKPFLVTATVLASFLISCSSFAKIIKFQKQPDEIYANNNLKEFFKNNRMPDIVLRVPNNNDKATSNTMTGKDNNVSYNAIEKELVKEGFSVRDRGFLMSC